MPKSNHKSLVWSVLNKTISYKPVLICVCTVWQAALPFHFSFTFFLRKFMLTYYLFHKHLAHSLTKKFLEHNLHAEAAVVIAGHIREVTVQYLISETEQYLISEIVQYLISETVQYNSTSSQRLYSTSSQKLYSTTSQKLTAAIKCHVESLRLSSIRISWF